VFVVNSHNKTVKLSIRSVEVCFLLLCFLFCELFNIILQLLSRLREKEEDMGHQAEACSWHPEFGSWMVRSCVV
jgi:hypothetical protein